jgi:hypothetical protein
MAGTLERAFSSIPQETEISMALRLMEVFLALLTATFRSMTAVEQYSLSVRRGAWSGNISFSAGPMVPIRTPTFFSIPKAIFLGRRLQVGVVVAHRFYRQIQHNQVTRS